MRLSIGLALTALLLATAPALAQTKANRLFSGKPTASKQAPAAIGAYAKGCAAGSVQLAETGPTWQAMRLSRNRNWGHPDAIAFIKRLSAFAAQQPGWKGLYIGDISQPRGGPMKSGHQSHQIGLDIDIWMLPPKRLNLSRREREALSSISVRAPSQKTVNRNWTAAHGRIIEQAARDPAVDRIFVTPPVKIELCKRAKRKDKKWLQKVRPLFGHHYHFHVRLKCPKGDRGCVTQKPTVAQLSKGGDGCDETLEWWVTDYLNPPKVTAPKVKKPRVKKKNVRDFTMADLPKQCRAVLAAN